MTGLSLSAPTTENEWINTKTSRIDIEAQPGRRRRRRQRVTSLPRGRPTDENPLLGVFIMDDVAAVNEIEEASRERKPMDHEGRRNNWVTHQAYMHRFGQ